MTDKKFKVGDKVRQTGPSEMGFTDNIGQIGIITKMHGPCSADVDWQNGKDNAMPITSLEHVNKSQAACILTEKVTIDGMPCRRIMGFEGINQRSDLPAKYVCNEPSFWLVDGKRGRHVFQDGKMRWVASWEDPAKCRVMLALPDEVKIDVGGYAFDGIQERSVWPETTFQELLVWLKRAGARLAKIRKQEKAAWSGKETIEI